MTPEDRIAELEDENIALRQQVASLAAEVQELRSRLAKDSHNSSKPPSSDGLIRKTRSLRHRSGRKPGGQIGHRGETLPLVATPEAVSEHRPIVCSTCQTALDDEPAVIRERRQMWDLPVLRLPVREHRQMQVRCPVCQQVSVGAFPAEVPSRVQYGPRLRALVVYLVEQQLVPYGRVQELLTDLFGLQLSPGTFVAWVQQSAAALEPVEAALKAALEQAPVLHSDETGVRQAGRLAWAHVASTQRLTHYAVHAKRGAEATTAIGILPGYHGVSVHDGWMSYRTYQNCRHALCNIHHLRELTFVEEQERQPWATGLKQLLLEMKATTDHARQQGHARLAPTVRDAFVRRYRTLVTAGLDANPAPERGPPRRGRVKQSPARNLAERLWWERDQVLAFLDDLTIPFDNNQAERDLRMLKVQQKVSGCFRSSAGAQAFARLRSYLSTLRKQGVALLAALESLFTGHPFYPSSV